MKQVRKLSKSGVHVWLNSKYGKPKKCDFCGTIDPNKWYDWASKDHKYRKSRKDFKRLCRSCHRKYDHKGGKWSFHKLKIINCKICYIKFMPTSGQQKMCGNRIQKIGCSYKNFNKYHLKRYHEKQKSLLALTKLQG